MKKPHKSPGRMASFRFAVKGMGTMLKQEPNFRIHLGSAVTACVLGWWLELGRGEWITVITTISLVLAAESFNTAVELIVDLVSPEYHPVAGKVKDISAAAVLIICLGAVFAGSLIYLPKIYRHFI